MEIQLSEFTMAYEQHGSGRPWLFIHGFPLNRAIWAPQLQFLSGSSRVVAPDLRGHGDSEPVAGPYSMDQLAQDCRALLESLDVQVPAVVCGLSMGGYVALSYYRQFPGQVAGLVLAATRAGADSPEGKQNRDKMAAQAREQGVGAIVDAMLPKMLAPQTYKGDPGLVERLREIMQKTSLQGVLGALMGMKERPDSTGLLPKIAVPTLILHGADDQLIPFQEAQDMHTAIPNSQLRLLPDAGHLLNLEQPELFNGALNNFLASIS